MVMIAINPFRGKRRNPSKQQPDPTKPARKERIIREFLENASNKKVFKQAVEAGQLIRRMTKKGRISPRDQSERAQVFAAVDKQIEFQRRLVEFFIKINADHDLIQEYRGSLAGLKMLKKSLEGK